MGTHRLLAKTMAVWKKWTSNIVQNEGWIYFKDGQEGRMELDIILIYMKCLN